jgi:hypothetical protein
MTLPDEGEARVKSWTEHGQHTRSIAERIAELISASPLRVGPTPHHPFESVGSTMQMENHADFFFLETAHLWKSHIGSEWLLLRGLRKPLPALLALPPLNSILPVEARLHHLQAAIVASHCESP